MRRPLPLAALGLSLVLGTAGFHTPTQARVIDPERSERAGLVCSLAVVGVDGDNRLKEIYVRNRKVMGSTSSKKLGLRLTGLGMIDGETKDGVTTTRLAATSADGVPRQVSIVGTETSKTLRVSAIDFAQQKFKPRLFTDAYGYYAYTINHVGVLQRWTLTRLRSGKLAYRAALTLKTNLKNTVALTTASYRAKPAADILYTTTSLGALRRLTVPYGAPERASFQTLSARGYEGVTELSSGYCNGADRGVVTAIDPVAGTATWTVVTHVTSSGRAKAYPKGRILGAANWKLHAVM